MGWIKYCLEIEKYYFTLLFLMRVGIIYLVGYTRNQLKLPTLNLLLSLMESIYMLNLLKLMELISMGS